MTGCGAFILDTKKFVLIVSALTAVVCALTIVYNFASMPAYGDTVVSAVPLYAVQSNVSATVSTIASSAASTVPAVSSKTVSASLPAVSSSAASTLSSAAVSTSAPTDSPKATSSHKTVSAKTATAQTPVNLNTATVAQLETVPYIGAKKAQAIVDYRNAHGQFSSVDALDSVKGFGKKTIAKIRPYLTA